MLRTARPQKRLLADLCEKAVIPLVLNGFDRTKVICSRCWSPYRFAGLTKPTGSLLSCGAHLALPQLARGRGHRGACCAGNCMAVPPQRPNCSNTHRCRCPVPLTDLPVSRSKKSSARHNLDWALLGKQSADARRLSAYGFLEFINVCFATECVDRWSSR